MDIDSLFDIIFESAVAFNQMVIVIVGLALFMIGAALVIDHRSWTHKAKKVRGTVVGLREEQGSNNAMYYPVIEYVGDDGSTIQAESDSGSSSYLNKKIGARMDVFIMPGKPEVFRMRGKGFFIAGILLLLFGIATCAFAFIAYPFTPYTIIVGGFFLVLGLFKFKKHIKPRDQWEAPSEFMERTRGEFLGERRDLPFVDKEEARKRLKDQDKTFKKWIWVSVLIGLGLCVGGVYAGSYMMDMLENGIRAEGKVVDMEEQYSDGSHTYYPIVEFQDKNGEVHRFKDNIGTNPPTHRIGDDAQVLYKEVDPEGAMIDRGIWNWVLSAALFGVGLIVLLITFAHHRKVQYRETHR